MATLAELQEVVNTQAAKLALRYRLPKDSFYIVLAPKMLSDTGVSVRIERGYPVAMIYVGHLPNPANPKEFISFGQDVRSALSTIKEKHLYNCTEIVPISYYKSAKSQVRKWSTVKGQITIPDLIPKYRIVTEFSNKLVMTDTETGLSVEVVASSNESTRTMYDKARAKLSALVMPAEVEEETVDEAKFEAEFQQKQKLQFEVYVKEDAFSLAIEEDKEHLSIEIERLDIEEEKAIE